MHPLAEKQSHLPALLRTLFLSLALPGLLALSACPQKTGSDATGGAATTGDAAQPEDQTGAATSESGEAAADSTADSAQPAGTDPAAGDSTTVQEEAQDQSEAAAGTGQAEDAGPARPDEQEEPEPQGIWVDVDFMNATWNEDPEAKLSHLRFNIGADLARNDSVSAEIMLDDPKQEVYGELDIRLCKLRVYPYVSNARVTRESGSKQEYTRDGRYVFMLLDKEGKGLAVLEMDTAGEFQPAPPEHQPQHTSIVPIFNDQHAHIGYDITKLIRPNQPVEKILQVRINRGAFVTHQVTDPLGNVFVYRFPEIHLLVAAPEVDTSKPIRPV